ncbi:MAG: D-alanyl-D-alanine carboxypeptidase [Lachnospiraceae bacterium]|nr:D-alanyl-D-alanine carboxypeptidase [Lachnospiraceae bacterium]
MKKTRKRFFAIFLILTVIMSPCYTFAAFYSWDESTFMKWEGEVKEELFGESFQKTQKDLTTQANLDIGSPSAILLEAKTGTVIYEKNADEARRPASVTKVMTLLLIYEALDSGKMRKEDIVTISEYAASMGGSQCFFETGEQQTVEDMIKCIVIASGNDAAVAMGEHLAGSEAGFVEQMNQRAAELGMVNTHFENACGLEAEGHLTSARDIAIMSRELTLKHPDIFNYSGIWMDTIIHKTARGESEFGLANTNKLLKQYNGMTGLKTGYTSVAGYSICATATRNDVDLIAVVMGASTKEIRNSDVTKLFDYGFAKCKVYQDDNNEESLSQVEIKKGKKSTVALEPVEPFSYVLIDENAENIKKEIKLDDLKAPVKKGQVVGSISYFNGDKLIGELPVKTKETVEKLSYMDCFFSVLNKFFLGKK